MPPNGFARRLGLICLGLLLACWAVSLPLRCSGKAAFVGGFTFLDGALLGAALAMVTRTHRPLRIYGWLMIVLLAFWPLAVSWPPAGADNLHLWPHAPALLANYFDMLRIASFLLGIPYPFARLGYFAPDPRDEGS